MRQVALFLVIGVIATTSVATAKVWHVPDECPTIQAGIDSAAAGDTVLVAGGTYTGDGNRDIDFEGKAILVTSEDGPEMTVIDCQGDSINPHRGFYFHNGEDSSSVVKGFSITNGWATELGDMGIGGGGGILCLESSPTIEGNIITGNYTKGWGGGITCDSSTIIRNNVIHMNVTTGHGGGVYCCERSIPTIEGNTITENNADIGGGIYCNDYSLPSICANDIIGNTSRYAGGIRLDDNCISIVEGNTIAGNIAGWFGGGLFCTQTTSIIRGNTIDGNIGYYGGGITLRKSDLDIEDNNIINNRAASGGGICCAFTFWYPTIVGNIIMGNIADSTGGGISCLDGVSPEIKNNIIYENTAGIRGGGIYSDGTAPVVEGNTIASNEADTGGAIVSLLESEIVVLNSILWENRARVFPEIYVDETSSIQVSYSDIQGGWQGEGNIDADPLFVTGPHGDYYLSQPPCQQDLSPCVDAGDPSSSVPGGTTRTDEVCDTWQADMGYHYFPCTPPAIIVQLVPDTTTVERGGELGYTIEVTNDTGEDQKIEYWSDVYLWTGEPYTKNPIFGPKRVRVKPGMTSGHLSHKIPNKTLLKTYTLCGRIGWHPDEVWDEDCFEFTVVEPSVRGVEGEPREVIESTF